MTSTPNIIDFIEPGSDVTFDGDTVINNSIGKGAKVTITGNGNLVVKGDVADDSELVVEGYQTSEHTEEPSIPSNFSNINVYNIQSGGNISISFKTSNDAGNETSFTLDGSDVPADTNKVVIIEGGTLPGITIEGKTGHEVLLRAPGPITLKKDAGYALEIETNSKFTGHNVGDETSIQAYQVQLSGRTGDESEVIAKDFADIFWIGHSHVEADSITAKHAHEDASLKAPVKVIESTYNDDSAPGISRFDM